MAPSTIGSPTYPPLLLPQGFDVNKSVLELAQALAEPAIEAFKAQYAAELDRAKTRSANELAERYGLALRRIQSYTLRGILPGKREPGKRIYSYNTGLCDDAINKMRRPDGRLKGQRRTACVEKK